MGVGFGKSFSYLGDHFMPLSYVKPFSCLPSLQTNLSGKLALSTRSQFLRKGPFQSRWQEPQGSLAQLVFPAGIEQKQAHLSISSLASGSTAGGSSKLFLCTVMLQSPYRQVRNISRTLPFSSYFLSRYFLSCSFTNPFSGCPTEAIIVKSASIISNVVRAVDSGLVNTSQKKDGQSAAG
jgi:hypothetical protein